MGPVAAVWALAMCERDTTWKSSAPSGTIHRDCSPTRASVPRDGRRHRRDASAARYRPHHPGPADARGGVVRGERGGRVDSRSSSRGRGDRLALIPLSLAAASARRRLRRVPWVLWLQDVLPDAAATTGLMREGPLLALARRLERVAFSSASTIVVISETFRENLLAKGVPAGRLELVYNPATRGLPEQAPAPDGRPLRVLAMGNMATLKASRSSCGPSRPPEM